MASFLNIVIYFILVLVCSFNDLVGRWLALSLAQRASENEKLLAQKENLVPDDWMALFSSPVVEGFF